MENVGTEMGNASLLRERATWTRASLQDEGCQADEHFSCLFPGTPGPFCLGWRMLLAHAVPRDDWTGGRLERDRDVPEDPK